MNRLRVLEDVEERIRRIVAEIHRQSALLSLRGRDVEEDVRDSTSARLEAAQKALIHLREHRSTIASKVSAK